MFLCDCNEKKSKSQSFFLQPVKLYQQKSETVSPQSTFCCQSIDRNPTRGAFSALIEQEGDIWTKISGRRMEKHKSIRQGKVALGKFWWVMRRVMRARTECSIMFQRVGNFVCDHLWTTLVTTHSTNSEKKQNKTQHQIKFRVRSGASHLKTKHQIQKEQWISKQSCKN